MKRAMPLCWLGFCFLLVGCVTTPNNGAKANSASLEISFADPQWTGRFIPKGQQCQRFGGDGSTPALHVKNIPAEADAIILEFSDRDYPPMDCVGHGKIGYHIQPGTAAVTIPSVPGHSFDLPQGFFLVEPHRNPTWDKAGAYMPPCSGGRGNYYYVTVLAVKMPEGGGKKKTVLSKKTLGLGTY
ncbi:hypothetical protein [Desulfosoma sp.]